MKFSERWLREWVNPPLDTGALVEQLSVSGLDVDTVEPVGETLPGVVVGLVVKAHGHPNADRLKLCQVDFGGDGPVEVVCGAPNARAGSKFAFAPVGTRLPGGVKIKRSKIRGVQSHGMLCSAWELGLGDEHDGILELPEDAPVGTDVTGLLGLEDVSIDVDLTPNRGDCLGIAGVAREVGALNRVPVTAPEVRPVPAQVEYKFPITLEAPAGCPRYVGRVIRNIDPAARTPLWMVEKLRRSGIRAISSTVDVTNYVMIELGQPMHAFDLDRLERGIRVRQAVQGETLQLLDGKVLELTPDILVIADEERPVAIAGVMGGEQSGVADTTRHLLLEAAFFAPLALAGVARRFGLHTDASHRFERGVDPQLQRQAMERATALLLDIVGGQPGPILEAVDDDQIPARPAIMLRPSRIARLLGTEVAKDTVEDVLTRLGMGVEWQGETWSVVPPSYRFDINIEADLIEEIARVVGYDEMPSRSAGATSNVKPPAETSVQLQRLRLALTARGYQEAITFSFVSEALQQALDPDSEGLALANPLSSDLVVMRTSLWQGLVQAVLYNLNRQHERVRIFETGLRFRLQEGELAQERVLAGAVLGPVSPEQWGEARRLVDFYDVKADLEALLGIGGQAGSYVFEAALKAGLHPGQTASISRDGANVGYLGALHPRLAAQYKLPSTLYVFELALAPLEQGELPQFSSLSRFPVVRRDLSVVVDESVTAAALCDVVGQSGPDVLKNFQLFDVYRGEGIDSGRKSLSLGLTFQAHTRTLNDDEVDEVVARIVARLEAQFGAELRG
ncbi:MAG: phenylalanine--tRNA ligase subunit beta [Gammaproteobacteria bacterium]|nr:phenylalanine--tRNA ligase subunit beta [Gammaproteobacteria bacterium]